jgi:hypothetical protein
VFGCLLIVNDIYYKETILNFAFQLSMHSAEPSRYVNVTCSMTLKAQGRIVSLLQN